MKVVSSANPEHPWALKLPLGWTCVGPSEPKFKWDTSHSVWVHNILIRDWLLKPFELPMQELEQKVLGKGIVILNMSFDGNLDALVRKSFNLDELGLKDQIRMTG
jgi:hypothetical protein